MLPLHSLPPSQQEAINLQVERLKAGFGFQSDLLSLDELAKVMGKKVNYLWNLRNRGQMPPIPVTRVGGHDQYWIVHVVMWLMPIAPGLPNESIAPVGSSEGKAVQSLGRHGKQRRGLASEIAKGAREASNEKAKLVAAKKAIIDKGMKILAERAAAKFRPE